jgi:peroxiredoxin
MREIKSRKLNRPKYQLYKALADTGAWSSYPVCTFKHHNLYNRKEYVFEGHIIDEIIVGDFIKYKIMTYDGKTWQKHKILDDVKIIKPGSGNTKKYEVTIDQKTGATANIKS